MAQGGEGEDVGVVERVDGLSCRPPLWLRALGGRGDGGDEAVERVPRVREARVVEELGLEAEHPQREHRGRVPQDRPAVQDVRPDGEGARALRQQQVARVLQRVQRDLAALLLLRCGGEGEGEGALPPARLVLAGDGDVVLAGVVALRRCYLVVGDEGGDEAPLPEGVRRDVGGGEADLGEGVPVGGFPDFGFDLEGGGGGDGPDVCFIATAQAI